MQPEDADTPARRIYFPIMMMYLDSEDTERYYNDFALRMTEFMSAITHSRGAWRSASTSAGMSCAGPITGH